MPFYYLFSIDPDYTYLFNGLNLAHLNFPTHIDHPGTPLQLLVCIVLRVVHLFHNPSWPIDKDVFTNSEFYLKSIVIVIFSLVVIAHFILGKWVYKSTKKMTTAIFLQATPFVSTTVLCLFNRILVEHLLIFWLFLIIPFFIAYIFDDNTPNKKNFVENLTDKYVIGFSILMSLGIATKITFFPVAVIPLILLNGNKKIIYFGYTMVAFSIFAFPIFHQWVYFRNWVEGLLIHSGQYGTGP